MLKIKKSQDSTAYYSKLAYSNIQLNKFKKRALYTQKQLIMLKKSQTEAQATQTLSLGKSILI
jgi:hypothetical protein